MIPNSSWAVRRRSLVVRDHELQQPPFMDTERTLLAASNSLQQTNNLIEDGTIDANAARHYEDIGPLSR
jgi:hypothetical protein